MTSRLEDADRAASRVAVAPRVTLDDLRNAIEATYYTTANRMTGDQVVSDDYVRSLSVFTVCTVLLKNGFVFIGTSAPASPENFNEQLGRELALEDAIRQLWSHMGFLLKDKLCSGNASIAVQAR